ncbi:MAG: cytochrome c3 family protein [Thermoanaerobaculia bacterium]|nr:cytochrome c3 family protein [Thermoanaerobaculia bacterium]
MNSSPSEGRKGEGPGGDSARALLPGIALTWIALTLGLAPGIAAQELSESVEYCLMCHGDEGLTLELEDGTEMSLYVDPGALGDSVHGGDLVCTDCHEDYDSDDVHPSGETFPGRREYVLQSADACKSCHFDTYTRSLESIHFELLEHGVDVAPVCTDCHGAHDIPDPRAKETMMSRSCATCHEDVYETYSASVHGAALVQDGIESVPACADCHTAHTIRDPGTAAFQVQSPELCIDCHGDGELMQRFGLSDRVATTYMTDFHGVTAALADPEEVQERQLVVTCAHCHGVHDIQSPDQIPAEEMKARVEAVCADCHEGAAADFPAAWLSHYEPSLKHAPLVYLVELFYRFLIPFMVVGLALQVGLHMYRATVSR